MSRLRVLLCGLLWVLSLPALALELYQAESPVNGPDESSRAQGVARALEQVVVKVSGDARAGAHPVVVAALAEAGKLMQRFEYRQELVRDEAGRPLQKLYLIATFYPESVDELLVRAGLQVWGKERPRVLVLIEAAGRWLDRSEASELVQAAERRGLALRFSTSIDPDAAAALVQRGSGALSTHLGGGQVLYGRLGQPDYWLEGGLVATRIRAGEGPLAVQFMALADGLQQALASAQLAGSSVEEVVAVRIEGVQSAADYARVLAYLGRLTPVRAVQVHAVDDAALLLDLTVQGGEQRLRQTVMVGQLLTPDPDRDGVLRLRTR